MFAQAADRLRPDLAGRGKQMSPMDRPIGYGRLVMAPPGRGNRSMALWRRWSMRGLVAAVLATGALLSIDPGRAADEPIVFRNDTVTIESGNARHHFSVEVAETDAQRARGLMFRDHLAPDRGMLFDFKRDRYIAMWMRNTLIPLDMLFIDRSGRVTFIHERARPGSLKKVEAPARNRAVLELAGGTVARLGIGVGDRVLHAIFVGNRR